MSTKLKNWYLQTVKVTYCMFDNTWRVVDGALFDQQESKQDEIVQKLTSYTRSFCDKDQRFIRLSFNKAQYEKVNKIVEKVIGHKVDIELSYIYNPKTTTETE
jgi:hypothetical protein